jgi:hypothetical protein
MKDREWNKLKVIWMINPLIEPEKLEKYFCSNCSLYWSCDKLRGTHTKEEILERRAAAIKFRYPNGDEIYIHKCFEFKKEEK